MGTIRKVLSTYRKPIAAATIAALIPSLYNAGKEIVQNYAYGQLVKGKNDDWLYSMITEEQANQLPFDRDAYRHEQRALRHSSEVAELSRRSQSSELTDKVFDVPSAHENRMPHSAMYIRDDPALDYAINTVN